MTRIDTVLFFGSQSYCNNFNTVKNSFCENDRRFAVLAFFRVLRNKCLSRHTAMAFGLDILKTANI